MNKVVKAEGRYDVFRQDIPRNGWTKQSWVYFGPTQQVIQIDD